MTPCQHKAIANAFWKIIMTPCQHKVITNAFGKYADAATVAIMIQA